MANYLGNVTGLTANGAVQAIRTQLQTVIPSHSNWSLVESTTMNAGLTTADVYKCSGAGNGFGLDFYIVVEFLTASDATLRFGLAEGYNTSTHKPQRPAMLAAAAVQTLQADGGILASTTEIDWYNGTTNPGGGNMSLAIPTISPNGPTDDYFVGVAADAFYIWTRFSANFVYIGAYDSLVPSPETNDPLPVIIVQGVSSTIASAMRQPMCGGNSGVAYPCGLCGASNAAANNPLASVLPYYSTTISNSWTVGNLLTPDGSDLYNGGNTYANRLTIQNSYTSGSATAGRDKQGWIRGLFRHVRYAPILSGITAMDTTSIDGTTYRYLPGFSQMWVEDDPS